MEEIDRRVRGVSQRGKQEFLSHISWLTRLTSSRPSNRELVNPAELQTADV